MSYRTEFPDITEELFSLIPAGFEDVSWRHDACPCFVNAAKRVFLWIERADPAMRENVGWPRFMLTEATEDGQHPGGDGDTCIVSTDDYAQITAILAAR